MNELISTILERRSVREYQPKPVDRAQLFFLVQAGDFAPSAMNQQGRKIVALSNRARIDEMLAAGGINGDRDPYYGAQTAIVVFADKDCIAPAEGASLSLENMMLAAHAMGLGSCWIHIVTRIFETEAGKELQKKWGVPENYFAVGSIAVGTPAGPLPDPKPRRQGVVTIID